MTSTKLSASAQLSHPILTAVESIRTTPTQRAAFCQAKIIHVLEGHVSIETLGGFATLDPGMTLCLGAGRWCRLLPHSRTRLWTAYLDERFFRTVMGWFLPDTSRIPHGLHPLKWDGAPIVLNPGLETLEEIEPLWRQIAGLPGVGSPEVVAIRTVELFARWMRRFVPTFVPHQSEIGEPRTLTSPVARRLSDTSSIGYVGRATELLWASMNESWTVSRLAQAVQISRNQLTRQFVTQVGAPPMRYLASIRLVEFTRLIDETDLSVEQAARTVGWTDPRVAAAWFTRRFGMTPSDYRLRPHRRTIDSHICVACRDTQRHSCGEIPR